MRRIVTVILAILLVLTTAGTVLAGDPSPMQYREVPPVSSL